MTRVLCVFIGIILFLSSFTVQSNSVLIGDSNVHCISKNPEFPSLNVTIGTHKGGINCPMLISMLKWASYNRSITKIYVAIGTNDCYIPNASNAMQLKKILLTKYPNAKDFYVIYGSLGWGGVAYKTPCNQKDFYVEYEKIGFKVINTTSDGYNYKSCNGKTRQLFADAGTAHDSKSEMVKYVIKRIKNG